MTHDPPVPYTSDHTDRVRKRALREAAEAPPGCGPTGWGAIILDVAYAINQQPPHSVSPLGRKCGGRSGPTPIIPLHA